MAVLSLGQFSHDTVMLQQLFFSQRRTMDVFEKEVLHVLCLASAEPLLKGSQIHDLSR